LSKNKVFSITSTERYSLALYELAKESKVLAEIEDQSLSILNLILSNKDFSNLIKDPTNNQDDLLKVIYSISDNNKFEGLLKKFLSF
jgi:F-type H+-transporting ATPase subunit delta